MTLKQMAEQVILRYKGSRPTQDTDLDEREVYDLIIKVLNSQLKLEYFEINVAQQERFVPNAAIASYEINVIAETGTIFIDKQCYLFKDFVYSSAAWATENDEPWQTEGGDNWSSGSVPEIKITENGSIFTVSITGFSLAPGKTAKMLADFIKGGDIDSYFTITGLPKDIPSVFSSIGVKDVIVTDNSIVFNYDESLATLIDSELLPIVGPSIDLLGAKSYIGTITGIQRCDNKIIDTRGRAKITLPAQPIALPRGMGIWSIGNYQDIYSQYIPIQPGEHALLKGISHTGVYGAIGRITAYEWYSNKTVYFNKKASEMPAKVLVRLVVADPSTIGEYDLLPIPADKELEAISKVLELLKADGQPDVKTDKLP